MTKAEKRALLRSVVGIDLYEFGKVKDQVLDGMIQRVRLRAARRALGLQTVPIRPRGHCAYCGRPEGSKSRYPRWRGEWVAVHPECEPLVLAERDVRLTDVRGFAALWVR